MNEFEAQTAFREKLRPWFQYLENCKDENASIWLLSNQPSTFILTTIDFKIGSGLSIIDPFDGRFPWLLNKEFCNQIKFYPERDYAVRFCPTVLLDSQILTLLRKYFDKDSSMKLPDKRCIHQLLKFFATKKCDISPFFYYIESLVKNENLNEAKKQKYAIDAAETILKVHLMDEEIFLNEDCVTPDWERFENYKKQYDISSDCIKDLAPIWYKKNFSGIIEDPTFIQDSKDIVSYTYVALLKMILIHKTSGRGVVKKLQDFFSFLEHEDFNVFLMRESLIAAYYFSNNLPDKFIQIQSDMTFDKVRQKILSTAWDFLLLRMPEIQLMYGTAKDTTFSYVCSADRAVQKLGRLFTIELVSNQAQIPSIISLKHKEISQDLGEEVANKLCSKLREQNERRQVNLILNGVNPVLKEKLEVLASNLEDQVRVLCKQ